jgi:hypothetical protein
VSSGAAPGFATRQSLARLRARTVARRLAIAVLGLLLIAAIGGFVYVSSLRGVGDAQRRASRIIAAHHEPAVMPAPARLAAAAVSVEDEHFKYYGHGLWGATEAAMGYFGTTPAHLTWAEAAMLGGLPQAPSAYDPLRHYALARARERHVLPQLVVNHHLSPRQAAAVFSAPLPLR